MNGNFSSSSPSSSKRREFSHPRSRESTRISKKRGTAGHQRTHIQEMPLLSRYFGTADLFLQCRGRQRAASLFQIIIIKKPAGRLNCLRSNVVDKFPIAFNGIFRPPFRRTSCVIPSRFFEAAAYYSRQSSATLYTHSGGFLNGK